MKLLGHSWSRTFGFVALLLAAFAVHALPEPALPSEGVISPEMGDAMDPSIDYSLFTGRVSDKDDRGRIFKVQAENTNARFFRAGDTLYFTVQEHASRDKCKGFVRNVEDVYFTMYVENLEPCWGRGEYFRRGTVLVFNSPVLAARVFEATKYRDTLILRKEDFLKQLNAINHFLWTFDQQKIRVAADYDARILDLQRAKQTALDDLIHQKQEQSTLQIGLQKRLDELDESLKFYRIDRVELLTDRWTLDHDASLPVQTRPQPVKQR